jgi:hypothetical protein
MRLRSSGLVCGTGKGFFLKMSRPDVGRTRIQRVPAALFREVERLALVSAHTTPTRTEVDSGALPPLFHALLWRAQGQLYFIISPPISY